MLRGAQYDAATKQPLGWGWVAEAEMRAPSTGQGTGADVRLGLCVGGLPGTGTGNHGLAAYLNMGTTKTVRVNINVLNLRTENFTLALDTWYVVRLVCSGLFFTMYVDERGGLRWGGPVWQLGPMNPSSCPPSTAWPTTATSDCGRWAGPP